MYFYYIMEETTQINVKETITETNIQKLQLNDLEQRIVENHEKSKQLFENISKLQDCYDVTYTKLTKEELAFLQNKMSSFKDCRNEELEQLCALIRKYLESIVEIEDNKTIHKQNIQHMLNTMYEKVKEICEFNDEHEQTIGNLYVTQLDEMDVLRKKLKGDIELDCCKEIRKVKKLIMQYYNVITQQLDKYANLLSTMNKNSKNYSYVMNKIYEYRLLYKRLMLYIKHYKVINKESIIACENSEANITHLFRYLEDVESYLQIRINAIAHFLMTAK